MHPLVVGQHVARVDVVGVAKLQFPSICRSSCRSQAEIFFQSHNRIAPLCAVGIHLLEPNTRLEGNALHGMGIKSALIVAEIGIVEPPRPAQIGSFGNDNLVNHHVNGARSLDNGHVGALNIGNA